MNKHPLKTYVDLTRLEPKQYLVKFFPTRFRDRLSKIVSSGNSKIRLIQNSVAVRLQYNNGSITSVACSDGNSSFLVRADKYVVCAGAFESPRLLMQSLQGTPVYNNILGRGLMDHPFVVLGEIRLPRMVLYGHHGRNSILIPNSRRIGFRIPVVHRRTPTMNHSLFFRPHFNQDSQALRDSIRKVIYGGWRAAGLTNLLNISMLKSLLTLGLEKAGIGYITNRILVSAQLEQLIHSAGEVTLSREFDRHGRQIPLIKNSITDDILVEAQYLSHLVAGLTHVNCSYSPSKIKFSEFSPGAHHSGTCRLGMDPRTSVVDLNLRYHGIENLYICDGSVLSKIGNGNLSLTLACLASRLARALSKKL